MPHGARRVTLTLPLQAFFVLGYAYGLKAPSDAPQACAAHRDGRAIVDISSSLFLQGDIHATIMFPLRRRRRQPRPAWGRIYCEVFFDGGYTYVTVEALRVLPASHVGGIMSLFVQGSFCWRGYIRTLGTLWRVSRRWGSPS